MEIVGSYFYLNIIKWNGNVIYLKFTKENDSILFERSNKQELEKLNLSDTDFDVYIYGTFCSFAGSPPKKCEEMLNLVNENNYNQLAQWLKSINPELATYGYVGLYFLEQKGVELLPAELKRMEELEKLNIQINICEGCIFGITEKTSKILNKNELRQNYLSFEQYGWLK
jgi:hypothetical protein